MEELRRDISHHTKYVELYSENQVGLAFGYNQKRAR